MELTDRLMLENPSNLFVWACVNEIYVGVVDFIFTGRVNGFVEWAAKPLLR